MSIATTAIPVTPSLRTPGLWFASAFVGLAIAAAALAGAIPIEFSIAAVFLFGGPHNWIEVRYALGCLPARAGKLWPFFLLSATGIVGLTLGFAAIPWLAAHVNEGGVAATAYAVWNSTFLFWVAGLIWMRSRTNPRFDGGWVWPLACLLCAAVWLNPIALNVALIYLHPLMALGLLDRELTRSRPEWRRTYRCALASIPLLLVMLWWHLHGKPGLPGNDAIAQEIIAHTGADFLAGISTHFLVAAHVFLEMIHYGAWLVLIPLIGMKSWPWDLRTIPAVRRNRHWQRGIALVLVAGLGIVSVLWICFGLDYATTRSIYFTVAMLHVLAEVPFLLRMV
jgi:hypothetical protein